MPDSVSGASQTRAAVLTVRTLPFPFLGPKKSNTPPHTQNQTLLLRRSVNLLLPPLGSPSLGLLAVQQVTVPCIDTCHPIPDT